MLAGAGRKPLFLALGAVVLFVLAEVTLRLAGYPPWSNLKLDANEPTMLEPDPVTGWHNRAGRYVLPAHAAQGEPVAMTFLEGGLRASGNPRCDGAGGEMILLGDSYVQGWAVADDETFAARLQQAFPDLRVCNYGTGAFSTYQAFLTLERVLPRARAPALVLYGFNQHHEGNNLAPAGWMATLSRYPKRGHLDLPYATLDEAGELVRHPPERHPRTPLRERLATVAFAEKAYMRLMTMGRQTQRQAVMETLLLEMDGLAADAGAEFVVVLLEADDAYKAHYMRFLAPHDVPVIDCAFPLTPEFQIPVDGHPNAALHARWARCIEQGLAGMPGAAATAAASERSGPRPE